VPDLVDPFYGAVVATIGAVAQERGYGTLVTATGFDADAARTAVAALLGRSLAGLVLAPVSADQGSLADAAVPVVLVDQPATGGALDSFLWEDLAGGLTATRHLLGHGFRRIGFLGRTPHLATTHERLAGYREALAEAGAVADERLVVADVVSPGDVAAGYAELRRSGADAVFCADPRTTIGCLPATQRDPAAIVGFGGFPLADLLTPSITVVDQDPAAMGRRAAERLFARIDGSGGEAIAERLSVALVERASCRIGV
jgi:LacI family transcriptional regulator